MTDARWTDDDLRKIAEAASRQGFGEGAGLAMANALAAGDGGMAQFGHPELGGMGQWSAGGMLMIGDMFNDGLKHRVGNLANELSQGLRNGDIAWPVRHGASDGFGGSNGWWPGDLGRPSSTGSQNGRRYAVFPDARRLAVERDGRVAVYDTEDRAIYGASQQQGGTDSLTFSTDRGPIGVEHLREVGAERVSDNDDRAPAPAARDALSSGSDGAGPVAPVISRGPPRYDAGPTSGRPSSDSDPVTLLRRLAELKNEGVITEDEFAAKKTDLLSRL